MHRGKYRTRPFEQALQEELGKDTTLFGGQTRKDQFKIKVAVTSTANVESEPMVLTNYNRPEPNNRMLLSFRGYEAYTGFDLRYSSISI
jgi:hypothetical protein